METGPPLPEHPELRVLAAALESAKLAGEILDSRWRIVFISSEEARVIGVTPSEVGRFYGKGLPGARPKTASSGRPRCPADASGGEPTCR